MCRESAASWTTNPFPRKSPHGVTWAPGARLVVRCCTIRSVISEALAGPSEALLMRVRATTCTETGQSLSTLAFCKNVTYAPTATYVSRAPACQAGGRGFEPRHSRHFIARICATSRNLGPISPRAAGLPHRQRSARTCEVVAVQKLSSGQGHFESNAERSIGSGPRFAV